MKQPARAVLAAIGRESAQRMFWRVGGGQIFTACAVPIGKARAAQVGAGSTAPFMRRELPLKPTPRRLFK